METAQTSPNNDNSRAEMLSEYERAQEVGHHTDTIIHEVTAIVWGANTLLLGFILEVQCNSDNQWLVIVAAVIGAAMSVYVPIIHSQTKKIQRIAYGICRDIEQTLNLPHRLNSRIQQEYPKWRPGFVAIIILTILFIVAWLLVIVHASICLRASR